MALFTPRRSRRDTALADFNPSMVDVARQSFASIDLPTLATLYGPVSGDENASSILIILFGGCGGDDEEPTGGTGKDQPDTDVDSDSDTDTESDDDNTAGPDNNWGHPGKTW